MEVEEEQPKLSPSRALTALLILLSAMLACALGLYFGPKHSQQYETIDSLATAPWLSALLLAYGCGSIHAFIPAGDPKRPRMPTPRVWALLLGFSGLVWFGPLLFSVGRLSWNQAFSISLGITIIGSFLLVSFKRGRALLSR